MLSTEHSGANIHIENQATPTMDTVVMSNDMTAILPDGSTMGSSHISTLQLTGLSNQARQFHIVPKMKTAPLISLGVLCDDGCTTTLDK